MSFVSSKGNILCRLIKIELYKIFAIINRAIKGLHCIIWFEHYGYPQYFIQNHRWGIFVLRSVISYSDFDISVALYWTQNCNTCIYKIFLSQVSSLVHSALFQIIPLRKFLSLHISAMKFHIIAAAIWLHGVCAFSMLVAFSDIYELS